MTTTHPKHSAYRFIALDVSLELIRSLRGPASRLRRHDAALAKQLQAAASSIAANLGEGRRRVGKDRTHFFRIASGSADETRVHLLVAEAWGWLRHEDIEASLNLADRLLALTHRLTH